MSYKFRIYTVLAFLTMTSCTKGLEFEKIEHETIYRHLRPTQTSKYLSENWIVHHYYDSKKNEAAIDAFVCSYVDTISRPYGALALTFYKYSRKYTNMKILTRRPDNISESLVHDYLWHYTLKKDGSFRKMKVKNFENREFFVPGPLKCIDDKQ